MEFRMISYYPTDEESMFPASVMVNHIVHLSKDEKGENTLIHLTTGEILHTTDSIKTLQARINDKDWTN